MEDTLVFIPKKTSNRQKILKVPLSKIARTFIEVKTGLLFNPVSDQKTNQHLKDIFRFAEINIPKICYQVSRHTFATIFLELQGDAVTLKELMGHSKIDTTMIYVHIHESTKKQKIKVFDEAFTV